jgi:hypothetical protein
VTFFYAITEFQPAHYWYTAKLLPLISSTVEKLVSFTSKVRFAAEQMKAQYDLVKHLNLPYDDLFTAELNWFPKF